ncbi:hypothetical protein [Aureispira anguillae]|uniref:Uncharacterized protein n=1 Tax=Aureispira anguillae TaxID=2864201 RepID=A0A915YGN7_9BACT|nr:hypothetical protein [Aureispira anguillae]BDS12812.1 hypothetical protein AsAng_0035370 [Aureispira anguillae]
MNRFVFITLFIHSFFLTSAQTIQQRIDWGQTIRKDGIIEYSKTTHRYNRQGLKIETYYKLDIGEQEGEEFLRAKLFYDIIGRVQLVEYYEDTVHDFDDNPSYTTIYQHNKNYTLKRTFGLNLAETKTYYYKDSHKRISEVKEIKEVRNYLDEDQSAYASDYKIAKWVLKNYNQAGLLLGERYKKSATEDISKTIYTYDSETKLLLSKKSYALTKTKSLNQPLLRNTFIYHYDSKNRLVKVENRDSTISYLYKNNLLWIKEKKTPWITQKDIYKDGVLVTTKWYDFSSKYNSYLKNETGLIKTINYHFDYYKQEVKTKPFPLLSIEKAIQKQLADYSILDVVTGDLNLDDKEDAVVVLEKICDPSFGDYMDDNSFCRLTALLIQESPLVYRVQATNKFLFQCKDCSGPVGDSYDENESISIDKGTVQFSSAYGSSDRDYTDVSFEYNKKGKNWFLATISKSSSSLNEEGAGRSAHKNYSNHKIPFKDYRSDLLWKL